MSRAIDLLPDIRPTTDQIAERAYQFWLFEGRPQGRAEVHWALAEALVQAEMDRQLRRTHHLRVGAAEEVRRDAAVKQPAPRSRRRATHPRQRSLTAV
ncbi:MAG: DUF2934 domain-containing protein [Phycisphaeraceae bacterium]